MFFVVKKRFVILVLVLIISIIPVTAAALVYSPKTTGPSIVIDAGHGGIDSGVIGKTTGVKESDLTLEIAKLVEGYAKSGNYLPVMTRKNASGLYGLRTQGFKIRDMKKRAKIINSCNPTIVVSIHMNYFPDSSRRGIQVFYGKNEHKEFADSVQNHINKTMNYAEVGRNFAALKGDYYILNNSPCEAIIIECGFLSNDKDEKLLLDADYRMLLAYNIFSAINAFVETKPPDN